MKVSVPNQRDLAETLGLAEIYLLDGAPITALQLVRQAMEIADPSLPEGEDPGDVSDHILRAAGVRGI
ncbi:MAG: hypothetical protein ACJ71W_00780 [Terriglobales bacterium]